MLIIRFQRTGRRNIPTYRLIVVEKSSSPKRGRVTEYLGHYLPARHPHVFEFERERVEHWLKVGAQPSDTAARLLTRAGMKGLEKFITPYTKRKKKEDVQAAEGAAPAEPVKGDTKKEERPEKKEEKPAKAELQEKSGAGDKEKEGE